MRCLNIFVLLLLVVANFTGCAGVDEEFAEEYKEFYADELAEAKEQENSDYIIRGEQKYPGKPPTENWISLDNSEEVQPFNPSTMRLLLKRGTDRYIIVRSGKQAEYGIPETMNLLDSEFAYLAKMGNDGDFIGKIKFTFKNKLFKNKDFLLYDIRKKPATTTPPLLSEDKKSFNKREPGESIKKDLCFIIKDHNRIHFFELYTSNKHYVEDKDHFIEFLESIKGPPSQEKDAVDRIKEKARQL